MQKTGKRGQLFCFSLAWASTTSLFPNFKWIPSVQQDDLLWSVDLVWMPGAHKISSITSLCNWMGERKCNKTYMNWDEDKNIIIF